MYLVRSTLFLWERINESIIIVLEFFDYQILNSPHFQYITIVLFVLFASQRSLSHYHSDLRRL
jgi:hypothetical protein